MQFIRIRGGAGEGLSAGAEYPGAEIKLFRGNQIGRHHSLAPFCERAIKPRKLPMVAAVTAGIISTLVALFVFDIDHYAVRLGYAVMLLVLVLFARPWHKSVLTDDDDDDDEND